MAAHTKHTPNTKCKHDSIHTYIHIYIHTYIHIYVYLICYIVCNVHIYKTFTILCDYCQVSTRNDYEDNIVDGGINMKKPQMIQTKLQNVNTNML